MNSSPTPRTDNVQMTMYYDGIGIIAVCKNDLKFFEYSINLGKNMVQESRQKGDSEKLATDIKKEMDAYSKILKIMSPNTHPTQNHFEQMIKHIPTVEDKNRNFKYFSGLWVSNISALLELGVIQHDSNNGHKIHFVLDL